MNAELRKRFELVSRLPEHKARIVAARRRIDEWLTKVSKPYVAFSTGKDSTVVLALVRQQAPDTPAIYIDASCAYPESEAMLAVTPNVLRVAADEPLLVTLARYGLGGEEFGEATMESVVYGPVRRIAAAGYDGVAYGLRAEESRERLLHTRSRGAIFQYRRDGLWACQPIWDWRYDDVWAYIVAHDLPYCKAYDRMWDLPVEDQRISFWAGDTKLRWGRYVWLKRNYPDLFNALAERIPEARAYV